MSDQQRWFQILEEIEQKFPTDQKVQQSISYLKSAIVGKPITANGKAKSSVAANLLPEQMELPETLKSNNQIALFSDGACLGNPGPGTWAAFAQNKDGEVLFESSSFDGNTTNNKMEMQGVINGLLRILDQTEGKKGVFEVFVYSDSKYVVDGANQWMPNWKKNGWKKADQKTPENLALWQQLDEVLVHPGFIKVHLHWVKGHAGHPQNEYCDKLCQNLLKQVLG